jgi:hypothetical protein
MLLRQSTEFLKGRLLLSLLILVQTLMPTVMMGKRYCVDSGWVRMCPGPEDGRFPRLQARGCDPPVACI